MINPFYSLEKATSKPAPIKIHSGNTKKCKSCKHFEPKSIDPCYNGKIVKPKSMACDKYKSK